MRVSPTGGHGVARFAPVLLSLAGMSSVLVAQPQVPAPVAANPPNAIEVRTLTLEQCLEIALKESHRRPASQFSVAMAEAQHRQALKVWDLESGRVIVTFTCDAAVHCVFAGAQTITAGDAGGRVHFLSLQEGQREL
jgi:hypothetical protein